MGDTTKREKAFQMFQGEATADHMANALEIRITQARMYIKEFEYGEALMKVKVSQNPLIYIEMVEVELWNLYDKKHIGRPYDEKRMKSLEIIYSNYKLKN